MDALSVASAKHKSQIASTKPWHVLLEVTPDPVNHPDVQLLLAREPDDVIYRGKTYIAFSFDFDMIWDKSSGELQKVSLKVSNIQRAVQGYLNQYNGGINMALRVLVVSAEDMNGDPAQVYEFGVTESSADAVWVTLGLGGANPMMRAMLRYLYFSNYCPWIYNSPALQATADPVGAPCGYWGSLATCNHSLTDCEVHNNQARFGGYPAIATQGFTEVSAT